MAVYFIQQGDGGPIKIGTARDPIGRLAEIQTGNPSRLHLLATVEGGRVEERRLHHFFRLARVRGEWFSPDASLLVAAATFHLGASVDEYINHERCASCEAVE